MMPLKHTCYAACILMLLLWQSATAYPAVNSRDSNWLTELELDMENLTPEDNDDDSATDNSQQGEHEDDTAGTRISKVNNAVALPEGVTEMDIRLSSSQSKRGVIENSFFHWPSSVIPYSFAAGLPTNTQNGIREGMAEIEGKSCVTFVQRNDPRRLHFIQGQGCYAFIGRQSGLTEVSIGQGCEVKSITTHEILHALGFFHEQSRPDRDNFVKINTGNIIRGMEHNFNKESMNVQNTTYDYVSVMHYGPYAFTSNGRKTIEAIGNPNQQLGNSEGLSTLDQEELNKLFSCAGKTTKTPTTTKTTTKEATTTEATTTKATTTEATITQATTTEATTIEATTTQATTTQATTTEATTTEATTTEATTTEATTTQATTTKAATTEATTTEATTTEATTTQATTTEATTTESTTTEATTTEATTTEATTTKATTTEATTTEATTTTSPITSEPGVRISDVVPCNFENGFCHWIQSHDDIFDWKLGMMRKRPKLFDHTTGKGYFVYAPTSPGHFSGDKATLYSQFVVADGQTNCLELFYSISQKGKNLKKNHALLITAEREQKKAELLAKREFNGNTKWQQILVDFTIPKNEMFRLSISAVLGTAIWNGGVAIDDISVYKGKCPRQTTAALPCSFERGFCSWTQPKETKANWRRRSAAGLAAVSGWDDVYVVARSKRKNQANSKSAVAILRSPAISVNEDTCMAMFAVLRNAQGGSLTIRSIDESTKKKTILLTRKGMLNRRWFDTQVQLPMGSNYHVEVVAELPNNRKSRIAVDDIVVMRQKCPPRKDLFFCDFEVGSCGISQSIHPECQWERRADAASDHGYVLSWDHDNCVSYTPFPWKLGEAEIVIPMPPRGSCLQFDYKLKKGSRCNLKLILLFAGHEEKRSADNQRVAFQDAMTTTSWKSAQVSLYPLPFPNIKLLLEVYLKKGVCENVDLDNIKVTSGLC